MKEKRMIGLVVILLSAAIIQTWQTWQPWQSGSGAQRVWAVKSAAVATAEMTDLSNLDQLKEAFQRDRGAVRLVALLSPICPACRSGFSDMQKVLKAIPDDRLKVYIVWLPMFPGDSRKWAQTRSDEFSDKRIRYYWDGERISGKSWQKVLGTKKEAWDVYLLYGADSQWEKESVTPDFWMHQLGGLTHAPQLDEAAFTAKAKELLSNVKR
jgi:hypothetical protein